jgi:hypothetical protein
LNRRRITQRALGNSRWSSAASTDNTPISTTSQTGNVTVDDTISP